MGLPTIPALASGMKLFRLALAVSIEITEEPTGLGLADHQPDRRRGLGPEDRNSLSLFTIQADRSGLGGEERTAFEGPENGFVRGGVELKTGEAFFASGGRRRQQQDEEELRMGLQHSHIPQPFAVHI